MTDSSIATAVEFCEKAFRDWKSENLRGGDWIGFWDEQGIVMPAFQELRRLHNARYQVFN